MRPIDLSGIGRGVGGPFGIEDVDDTLLNEPTSIPPCPLPLEDALFSLPFLGGRGGGLLLGGDTLTKSLVMEPTARLRASSSAFSSTFRLLCRAGVPSET